MSILFVITILIEHKGLIIGLPPPDDKNLNWAIKILKRQKSFRKNRLQGSRNSKKTTKRP